MLIVVFRYSAIFVGVLMELALQVTTALALSMVEPGTARLTAATAGSKQPIAELTMYMC
jgi:hypothetical protein